MKSLSFIALLAAILFVAAMAASPPAPDTSQTSLTLISKQVDAPAVPQDTTNSIRTPFAEPEVTLALYGKPIGATRHERRHVWEPITYSDWIEDVPTPPNEKYFTGFANMRAREKV